MTDHERDPDDEYSPETRGEGRGDAHVGGRSDASSAFARSASQSPADEEALAFLQDGDEMPVSEIDANWEHFTQRFKRWPPPDAGVAYPPLSSTLSSESTTPAAPHIERAPTRERWRSAPLVHLAPVPRRHPMLRWAWAAAAVVVGVGAYAGWRRHVQAAAPTQVATMNAVYTGSNATVPVEQHLPDGTTFRLGRKSTLRLNGTWTRERTMQLIGDGYFEVASDPRPFIVQTDRSVTRVLGTKFFVNASHTDASVRVGVLSGRVAVASDKSPNQMSVLDSGYVGNVSQNGKTTVAFDPNIAQDIGWVHGAYVMHNTSIPDVMAYLSDRFDVHMVAAPGSNMAQGHLNGTFPADYSLFECLKALKMAVGLRYVWYGDKLVVARLPYHQLVHDRPVEWMPPDSIAEAPPARLTPPPDPTPERLRGGSPRGGLTFVPDTADDAY